MYTMKTNTSNTKRINLKSMPLLIIVLLIILTGCSPNHKPKSQKYETITANEAQEIMKEDTTIYILDVRTESEYASGHIPNSILLPYDEVSSQAESFITNKDSKILVYCRSGRRSKIAAGELAALGYTNVFDFGGINDWPYEITTN